MEYNVNINGIDVDAAYSDETIEEIVKPLLKHMADLHDSKKDAFL